MRKWKDNNYSNHRVVEVIDEYIHNARDREILREKLVDGITYDGGSMRSRDGGSYDGYSGRRGRSPRTGRYVSREGGYSGHDGVEDILMDVRQMPESERRKLKEELSRM